MQQIGPTGFLWGLDQDKEALEVAEARLMQTGHPFQLLHDNFSNLDILSECYSLKDLDGIVFDLGTSWHQLMTPERGFSFLANSPLDMRMNQQADIPTALISEYSICQGVVRSF